MDSTHVSTTHPSVHGISATWPQEAAREFRIAAAAFPQNRIIRMYLGEAIPCKKIYPGVAGAPGWAVYQRESLERLTDIVEWWIDHRLRADGQYGGKWDDDCEMWRHWVPVMIAFEHPQITQAQALFSKLPVEPENHAGRVHQPPRRCRAYG